MKLALLLCLTARAWGAFGYYQVVTTTSSNTLLPASQSNFPALLYISDANLKDVGHGGKVQSSSGFDICPYTDTAHTTSIPSKIEYFDNVNGILWTRVKPATLSQGLTFALFYGDATVTTCGQDANTFDTNYKGFLPFSNGTSLSMTDLTGTLTASQLGATAAVGQVDGASSFSGIGTGSSWVEIANNAAMDTVPGTWSGWVKYTSSTAFLYVMGRTDSSSRSGPNLFNTGASKLSVQIKDAAGTAQCNITSSATVGDGAWHYVGLDFRSSATTTLYIDGSAASGGTCAAGTWSFNAQKFRFAVALDVFWGFFAGQIDAFRISNVSRSANWIATEYQNELAPGTFFTFGGQVVVGGGVGYRLVIE